MPLTIQIQQNIDPPRIGVLVVKLAGSLDTATAPELEQRLTPVLAGPITVLGSISAAEASHDCCKLRVVECRGVQGDQRLRRRLVDGPIANSQIEIAER